MERSFYIVTQRQAERGLSETVLGYNVASLNASRDGNL